MSGQHKHIYTSEDISRYHSGAMSQAEMHAMEKASLEDPFLADALEGFVYSNDMNAELASLRNSLQEKTDKKVIAMPVRNRNYGWMRIAALFLIIAAAGWIIFRMNVTGENDLAIQKAPEEKISDTKQADAFTGNTATADSTTGETYVPVNEEETIAAAEPTKSKSPGLRSRNISLPPAGVTDDYVVMETDSYKSNDTAETELKKSVVTTETVSVQNAPVSYGYTNINARTSTINGVVTDERNNAIPFASVIARNNRGTLTDNNGRFQLNVPDTVSVVDVNALGYQSRNINLKEEKEQPIVLRESNDKLEEVVLARSKKAEAANRKQPVKQTIVEIGELEPVGGWSEYNSYLADKLTAPKTAWKKDPSGVVELSFDVDANGNPINITVEKSLCASCDKEAIRLLKEGPKWKKQEGKGKITIRF